MVEPARIGVLFVCTANICRSPIAEGVFLHALERRKLGHRFRVGSAGTYGGRAGERPDPRAIAVAARHGITLPGLARPVSRDDLRIFDHLCCMDEDNREALLSMGALPAAVSLLLEHDPAAPILEVPDPYHGGPEGFDLVFRLIESGCTVLLARLVGGE